MESQQFGLDIDVEDKADWSASTETAFIHIMHDHVKNGDLQTSTFIKKIWSSICDELFNQTKKRSNIGQLKSKFNRLRKKHREFFDLLACTGLGWDPISNTVTASETVWADYIKKVPGVKSYRKKGLEHYQILGEIFNTTIAIGQLHFPSSQISLNSDEERELEDKFLNSGIHVDIDANDDDDDNVTKFMEHPSRNRKGKRPSQSVTPNERGNKRYNSMDNYFERVSEVMNARFERIKAKSAESTTNVGEMWSIQKCIDGVESLGDVDGNTFNKFMDKVVPSIEWRKAFLGMNEERKRTWLANL